MPSIAELFQRDPVPAARALCSLRFLCYPAGGQTSAQVDDGLAECRTKGIHGAIEQGSGPIWDERLMRLVDQRVQHGQPKSLQHPPRPPARLARAPRRPVTQAAEDKEFQEVS